MLETIFRAFAPHRCCSCGDNGALLCDNCKNNIIIDKYENCIGCLQPCGPTGLCKNCARKFDCIQAWCLGERKDVLKQLGDRYKFDCKREGGRVFSDLLNDILPILPEDVVVVGIPTTRSSVRARGFDHTGLIVKLLAKSRSLQTSQPLVRSTKKTLHFLSHAERIDLADTLFTRSEEEVPKKILLIDDIVTTGTTLRAAAQILKANGCEELYIAVCARQPFEG